MKLTNLIREAAQSHTRLNTFYAVIEILEGALPSGCPKASRTANSIIRQCKAAAQIQLEKYDDATAQICRSALNTAEGGDE